MSEFRNRINNQKEYFTKEIEAFEKNQIEILQIKNTLKETKNELVNLENTDDQMKKTVSDTEDI